MHVHYAPGPRRGEANADERRAGRLRHRDGHHGGLIGRFGLGRFRLGHVGGAGLHRLDRAGLPRGPRYEDADPDAKQFLGGTDPHVFRHVADAVGTKRDQPHPHADLHVTHQRPADAGAVGSAVMGGAAKPGRAVPGDRGPAPFAPVNRRPPARR